MRLNRLADIYSIRTQLERQRSLADHVNCMGANHAAAQDLAVAVGLG